MENEANAANVTEIEARLNRLAGKLRDLVPGSTAHNDVKEDMEDYYDRLVQIKEMRVNTLEELLKESEERETVAIESARAKDGYVWGLCTLCVVLVLTVAETVYPGLVSIPVSNTIYFCLYNTLGHIFLSAAATFFVTRSLLGHAQ